MPQSSHFLRYTSVSPRADPSQLLFPSLRFCSSILKDVIRTGRFNKRSENDRVTANCQRSSFTNWLFLRLRHLTVASIAPRQLAEKWSSRAKPIALSVTFHRFLLKSGWNAHQASEIGVDDFQANGAPDNSYRTTPLRGLRAHETPLLP
jgi:hypothetical protein